MGEHTSAVERRELRRFLQACEDFGSMSGGPFRAKYSDFGPHEGYGYIQKWAARISKALGHD